MDTISTTRRIRKGRSLKVSFESEADHGDCFYLITHCQCGLDDHLFKAFGW